MAASDVLSRNQASSASDRLASSGKPSGKLGSPAMTVKVRNKFSEYRTENPESDIQWEAWLEQNGYGLGDNDHVFKK